MLVSTQKMSIALQNNKKKKTHSVYSVATANILPLASYPSISPLFRTGVLMRNYQIPFFLPCTPSW